MTHEGLMAAINKKVLQLQIDELRRQYDNVFVGFNHTREKALALLAGEVAIVAFLFASDGSSVPFVPNVIFGLVITFFGIGSLTVAFVLFLVVLAPIQWQHPPATSRLLDYDDHINESPARFLKYLRNEYIQVVRGCIIKVSSRSKKFTWGLYLLSTGTFILMLIKYGGGHIQL